jgi:ATP-dependent 26S proteasome regulatory subunit
MESNEKVEPLLFVPFEPIEEAFCREEYPGGVYFQKIIRVSLEKDSVIEVKIMNDSSLGSNGTAISLNPKQLIVLRDLLAQVEIMENPQFHIDKKAKKSYSAIGPIDDGSMSLDGGKTTSNRADGKSPWEPYP